MSIATAIQNAQAKVAAAYTKCNAKGATMPSAANRDLSHLADTINSIPAGGGASNIITGEFTAQSSTGVQSITLSYSGSGYPIIAYIVVKGGMYKSGTTWYTAARQYAVGVWAMSKADMAAAPTYGTSGTANYGVTAVIYKSSASSSTAYSRSGGSSTNTFSSSNATNAAATCARFKSKTSLSIYASAASGTYGFMAGQTYQYVIVYSN